MKRQCRYERQVRTRVIEMMETARSLWPSFRASESEVCAYLKYHPSIVVDDLAGLRSVYVRVWKNRKAKAHAA